MHKYHNFDAVGNCFIYSFVAYLMIKVKKRNVKISLLQAVEAHRVARGQGSHIT
jgi:hypothetical protein